MGTAYGVGNCVLWLKADDASAFTYGTGTLVAQWLDASGEGRHAVQATATNQPDRSGVYRGRSTVLFDGVDNFLSFAAAAVPDSGFTLVALVRNTGTGDRAIVGGGSSGNYEYRISTTDKPNLLRADTADTGSATTGVRDGLFHRLSLASSTSLRSFYLDGVADGTDATAVGTYTQASFVGTKEGATEFGQFELAELLLFNVTLTDAQRQTVEAGLQRWLASNETDVRRRDAFEPGYDLSASGWYGYDLNVVSWFDRELVSMGTAGTTINAQVGTLTLTGVAGTMTPGAVSVTAQPGSLSLTGRAGVVTPGAVTINATPATITLTGQTSTLTPGAVTVTAQPGTITLSGIAGTVTPGAVSVTAQVGLITLTGVPSTISAGGTPATINAQVGLLTLTGVAGSMTPGAVSITGQQGLVALTGLTGTMTPGAVAVTAQPGAISLSGRAGTMAPGAVTVAAQIATITLTAQAGTVLPGTVTVQAQQGLITLTAVAGVVFAGTIAVVYAPVTSWRGPGVATYTEPGTTTWRGPQTATYTEPGVTSWREPSTGGD